MTTTDERELEQAEFELAARRWQKAVQRNLPPRRR